MPIHFSKIPKDIYYVCHYEGVLTDVDLLEAWKAYLSSDDWEPLNNLADLSRADLTNLSIEGIQSFANYLVDEHQKRGLSEVKVAIYAPNPLQWGLGRIFDGFTGDSPLKLEFFKDREEAIEWLKPT